jgi:predicted alpha/beta-hydrolase family hydrolase
MRAWASRLASLGSVVTFDYPYMQSGRKMPDPLPDLVRAHRHAIAEARSRHEGAVVLAGKSMGGRVGCHVAVEDSSPRALVCFGYPLVAPSKRATVRDAVLLELKTPILFLQGTRDPLCPLDHLAQVRERMRAPSHLHVVEGGDHSLTVAKSTLRSQNLTQEDVDRAVLDAVHRFLDGL